MRTLGFTLPYNKYEKQQLRLKFENYESVHFGLKFSGIKKGLKFHFIGTLRKVIIVLEKEKGSEVIYIILHWVLFN